MRHINASKWCKTMSAFAETLPPGTQRAQAFNIARKLKAIQMDGSIAQMMLEDNQRGAIDGALRASTILVDAGLATHESKNIIHYGRFTFIDGSYIE